MGSIEVQHEALVMQRKVEKWTLNHCINCDIYVYATGEDVMLVNANLMVSGYASCDATVVDIVSVLS
jgi:hypothetical protein